MIFPEGSRWQYLRKGLMMAISLFVIIAFTHCKTTFDKQRKPTLVKLGSFGGFAGSYTEYVIYSDGRTLGRKKYNDALVDLKPIDKSTLEQAFNILKKLAKTEENLQDPGTMSYFLVYENQGVERLNIVWGGGNETISPIVELLYRNLTSLCQEDHPVM